LNSVAIFAYARYGSRARITVRPGSGSSLASMTTAVAAVASYAARYFRLEKKDSAPGPACSSGATRSTPRLPSPSTSPPTR
jgi:hypothetical protein